MSDWPPSEHSPDGSGYRPRLGLRRSRSQYPVSVVKQNCLGSGNRSEVGQVLEIGYPIGGTSTLQRQIHIVTTFADTEATAALQLLMTCPAELFTTVGPEFTESVRSIRPKP